MILMHSHFHKYLIMCKLSVTVVPSDLAATDSKLYHTDYFFECTLSTEIKKIFESERHEFYLGIYRLVTRML